MEFSNIRPGSRYQYYSNEHYSLLAPITYGASDKHCHMDPYGRRSRHNDNTTKFRVISECICFWRRDGLRIWLRVTKSSQSATAGSDSKGDWLRLIKATEQWQAWATEGCRAIQYGCLAAPSKANKQHKHSSRILCIHNQVQNSDRDWYQNSINSWTQTWPNKYNLDCPSSRSWNQLDPGRVKSAIFSLKLCNCGLLKSPFHEWAVLGEMEKITQFITCPVITALHIEEG